jgi:hypothetical protein
MEMLVVVAGGRKRLPLVSPGRIACYCWPLRLAAAGRRRLDGGGWWKGRRTDYRRRFELYVELLVGRER